MQFNISFSTDSTASPDVGQLTDAEKQAVLDTMNAAATIWSWYLTAQNITLDLVIKIANSAFSGNTVAEGGPTGFYTTMTSGVKIYDAVGDTKLEGGPDRNGTSPDIGITLTVNSIRNLLYFRPTPTATVASAAIPSTRADALSVFLHEIGHGLGLASLSQTVNDATFATDKSTYDSFINSSSQFTGAHAMAAVSAGPIQLDPASIAHLLKSGAYGSDLMATSITDGTVNRVSALDLGMLQDIGVPLRAPTSGDDVIHAIGASALNLGAGNDTVYVDFDSLAIDGGSGVDTAVFSGSRSAYTITQTSIGNFTITGPDGTDTLSNVEYAKFTDTNYRLLPGTGTSVDFSAAPSTYMSAIRDFDGNNLGGAASWQLIGSTDVSGSGSQSHIYVDSAIGRWAEVGTAPDGLVYFNDYGWAGVTRVVGIYIDPLVASGAVQQGSATDSQRRFQNDLQIGNIAGILGSGDYDGDGLQEVYFRLTDGTAYLHAYMWSDGNIRYANYQSAQQVKDYLTSHGYGASTWGSWFPAAQTAASADTSAALMATQSATPFDLVTPSAAASTLATTV
jgi:hypothetical protein